MMQGKGVSASQAKASFTSEPPSPAPHPPPQISTRLTDWSKNMVVEILSSKSLGGNHYKAMAPGAPWAICITPPPNQVLYTSDAYPGRTDKMTLEGKLLGRF